jgi:probable HAF family extracellular repeat protein
MRRGMLAAAACAAACGQYTAKATVTIAVSGPGAVRAAELQGDCRSTCWFEIAREAPVHLEPVVDGKATFAGWSGACSGTSVCDLKPGTDVSVAATFTPAPPPQSRRLQVSMNGAGTVHSTPAGIDCPQTCAADFPDGTAVRLDATASAGWDFTGFGGACSGGSCSVMLSSDVSALATFVQRPVTVSVQMSGTGSVVSNPAGIDCPRICSAAFSSGTALTLTASAGTGFSFSGFSGACAGSGCSLRLTADAQVLAAFAAIPKFTVTVVTGGSGGGRVASTPAGIDCPGACSASFFQGTQVALSAVPDALSRFDRWTGSCSGASCAVVVQSDLAAAAEFVQRRYAVIDLGTPAGGSWTEPTAASPGGTVIAGTWGGPGQQGFLWDGSMRPIGPANGVPAAVNDSGTVVGNYFTSAGYSQAYRWDNGTVTELPSLGGPATVASFIDPGGIVLGLAMRADGVVRAVYWTSKGPFDLGSLGGAAHPCSSARAINSHGIIVGESCTDGPGTHAVRFRRPGEIDDLGTIGGGWSAAIAVNDAGVIVGYGEVPNGRYRGFVYAEGKMTDVGVVPGFPVTQLLAINASAVAVGNAYDASGSNSSHGIVYGSGKLVDLNALVDRTPFLIQAALGVNDAGEIVAQASDGGLLRAVILRPH